MVMIDDDRFETLYYYRNTFRDVDVTKTSDDSWARMLGAEVVSFSSLRSLQPKDEIRTVMEKRWLVSDVVVASGILLKRGIARWEVR